MACMIYCIRWISFTIRYGFPYLGIRLDPAKRRDASVFHSGRQSMLCMTGTLGSMA